MVVHKKVIKKTPKNKANVFKKTNFTKQYPIDRINGITQKRQKKHNLESTKMVFFKGSISPKKLS